MNVDVTFSIPVPVFGTFFPFITGQKKFPRKFAGFVLS